MGAQMSQGQMNNLVQLQQRRIAELEAENRDLRHQLDELRRGMGIAVLIEGRAIPLTALAHPPALRSPVRTHPSQPMPVALGARPSTTSGRMPIVRGPSAPSTPYSRLPLPQPSVPSAPPRAVAPAPDDGWLTGSTPALRPHPPVAAPAAPPSSSVTPAWLRDEAPTVVAVPMSQPAPASPTSHAPARRLSTGPLARPSVPRLQPTGFPTLAQITGRMGAVRTQPQPERWPGERNPYADSFVLG